MSTSIRDKIVAYLGQGIQQSVVASSCGVTPAYVSQLLELPDVREEIAVLRSKQLETALESDVAVERIEKAALRMVEARLPYVRNAVEAVKIAATLNGMKRKAAIGDQSSDVLAAQQVLVTVPRGASLHFKLNNNNQVIEVEGRTMAPLPSKALPSLQRQLAGDSIMDVEISGAPNALAIAKLKNRTAVPTSEQVEFKKKQEAVDESRAKEVLRDLTAHLNGVAVVL